MYAYTYTCRWTNTHFKPGTLGNSSTLASFKKCVLRKGESKGLYTTCPETKGLATSPSLLTELQIPAHCNHIKLCLMYYVKFSGDLPGEGSLQKFSIALVHM